MTLFAGTDDVKEHRPTIGIIAESGASVFQWCSTEKVLQSADCRVIHFTEMPQNRYRRRWRHLPARLAWRVLSRAEERLFKVEPPSLRIDSCVPLTCSFMGYFKEFPAAEIAKIRNAEVDLLIRLGGRGIYRGAVLDAATKGMISIHHGDNRYYRGGPPGFWEILNGEARCGYIVQRLTQVLDGGEVLARGEINSARCAALNRSALFEAADAALAATVTHFIRTGTLPEAEIPTEQLGPIYKMPGLVDLARYGWKAWISPSVIRRDHRGNETVGT